MPHRHGALEGEIEVFRRIAAIADRPVLDQGLGMDEAVLEAQTIDERLQGRAGRAQRLRHVDRAGAARIEIIRRGRPAPAPRRWRDRPPGWRPTDWRPAHGHVRGRGPRDSACSVASMVSRCRLRPGAAATTASAEWGASIGIGLRPSGTPSRLAAATSSAGTRPAAAKRSSTRSRAACAAASARSGRRCSGDCGNATSSADSAKVSRRGSLPK